MDMGSWDNNPLGGEERRGEERRGGEGRRAPHLTSPKGAKQFFRPEDAPLYLERGATMSKQTTNKPAKDHKCSMTTKKRLCFCY
jgi:hypothetical protein